LSDIVFVPEASEKSGSLITVDFAIQAHKEVFATPNDIYNIHSTGINKYISEHKIQAIYHISHFLQSHFASNNNATLFDNNIQVIENITDPKQQLIIKNLKFGSLNVEQLIEKT
jgi:predicted Rossmann fold nucleotide-binding protein DprA/Smf involved in DNA uptake